MEYFLKSKGFLKYRFRKKGNRSMKIIMIDYFLPNSIYSLELCDKLSLNHEVVLICKDNYIQNKGLNFKVYPVLHSKSRNPIQAFALYMGDLINIYRLTHQIKPDIMHLQGVQHVFWEKSLIRSLKKIVGKFFYTAHNILSHESKRGEKAALGKWYNNFDGIIVHNEMSKQMLIEASQYHGKIFVVPHGSYDTYKTCKNKKSKFTDKTVFLQFGLVRDYKGADILLDAISKLSKQVREKAVFIIAGKLTKKYYDFDLEGKVKELGIDDCTKLYLTRIEDDEVPDLFNNCDCCVFPYRHIYGSGALLMAYTFNKPVIVSSIPVFCEETENGKTGIIFEKNNSDMLAKAIERFCTLSECEKQQYRDHISEFVETKYNWTTSADLTVKAYSKADTIGESNKQ